MEKKQEKPIEHEGRQHLPGYPIYPANDDILNKQTQLDIDVENLSESTEQNQDKIIIDDVLINAALDTDFDIPGAELDDMDEVIGSEDEENNFYSEDDSD